MKLLRKEYRAIKNKDGGALKKSMYFFLVQEVREAWDTLMKNLQKKIYGKRTWETKWPEDAIGFIEWKTEYEYTRKSCPDLVSYTWSLHCTIVPRFLISSEGVPLDHYPMVVSEVNLSRGSNLPSRPKLSTFTQYNVYWGYQLLSTIDIEIAVVC